MRVHLVVVLEPAIELGQDRSGVGPGAEPDVIALEGLHEGLGDAVGLRAAHGREARHEADGVGERDRLVRGEAAAVVGEPLHRVLGSQGTEAAFDRKQHEIAHRDAADPAGTGGPGEHLAVVGVDGEGDPKRVAVPARDLEHIRGPAPVRGGGGDLAIVRAFTAIGSLDYTWDWRNRLASAERAGGGITSHGYDHTGQRVFKATGSATTSYPSRHYNVASSSLTATTTKHIFSPDGTLLATVVGASTTATTTYLHPDHLGGTNVTTDEDGEVTQTLDYYPYGSQRIATGSISEQRRFIGEEHDPDTEFSYLNARYYQGSRGQFLSQDPVFLALGNPGTISQMTQREFVAILADPQSWNSYGYARGNPILLKDSTGRWWELSGSAVIPGRAFTGGIRFDRNGIDVFGGGGIGFGLAGGIEGTPPVKAVLR